MKVTIFDTHSRRKKGNEKHHDMVRYELMERFGYYITESSEHNSEYTPYFIKTRYPELIEEFRPDGVSAITYHDEIEIGWNDYSYEELEDYLIDEIVEIMEDYDASSQKTMDRCKSENF